MNGIPRVGCFLINWGIGGAEKRYGRLFRHLMNNPEELDSTLVINRHLRERLACAGICFDERRTHTLFSSRLGRWFDRPIPDVRKSLPIRVRGPSFLVHRLFEAGRIMEISKFRGLTNRFDLVHFVFPNLAHVFAQPRRMVISSYTSCTEEAFSDSRFMRKMARQNAFFDVLSEEIRSNMVRMFHEPAPGRWRVAPCSFIDYSDCRSEAKEPLVIFAGRLEPIKNPLLFVDAVRLLRDKGLIFRAEILGEGRLESEVRARIDDYRLNDMVTVGFEAHPPRRMAKARVFVSLQTVNNYPSQALLEAMACGCAVVASDVGETKWLVNSSTGWTAPLDATAIAGRIEWMLRNPLETERMGQAARALVLKEHTIERYSEYLINLYRDVLSS